MKRLPLPLVLTILVWAPSLTFGQNRSLFVINGLAETLSRVNLETESFDFG